MIVVDASAFIELLMDTPSGQRVAERIENEEGYIHAPHLIDLEVTSVMRRLDLSGSISSHSAHRALESFSQLQIQRWGHTQFIPAIWDHRHNLTSYDAVYIALAEVLDAPLITCDAAMANAPHHTIQIELIGQ